MMISNEAGDADLAMLVFVVTMEKPSLGLGDKNQKPDDACRLKVALSISFPLPAIIFSFFSTLAVSSFFFSCFAVSCVLPLPVSLCL